jgi:hypothetical protein
MPVQRDENETWAQILVSDTCHQCATLGLQVRDHGAVPHLQDIGGGPVPFIHPTGTCVPLGRARPVSDSEDGRALNTPSIYCLAFWFSRGIGGT